jgi:hypothetical protein
MIHEILMDSAVFKDVTAGRKTHVMQKYDDAQYSVGDFLALNETIYAADDAGLETVECTGRCCLVRVTHICTGVERYLTPGTIILTIRPCAIVWCDPDEPSVQAIYEADVYGPGEGAES